MKWFFVFLWTCVAGSYSAKQMFALRDEQPVFQVSVDSFNEFFNGPRDHYLIALFTAEDEQFQCKPCQAMRPVLESVALSLRQDYPQLAVFTAIVDFKDNNELFQRLQMNTVPHIWIYPPSEHEYTNVTSDHFGYEVPESLLTDFNELTLHFANFVSQVLKINIFIHQPFDYTKFVQNFVIYLVVFVIIKRRAKNISSRLRSTLFYFILSLVLIFLSVTGYNFCIQRAVPFILKNDQGNIMYFSGGLQYQFGLEMANVSLIYLGFTTLMVLLLQFAPSIPNQSLRNLLTIMALTLVFFLYHLLNTIFHIKDPDYPFVQWKLF